MYLCIFICQYLRLESNFYRFHNIVIDIILFRIICNLMIKHFALNIILKKLYRLLKSLNLLKKLT